MFLKSPHKFTFSSLTFALVLSVNLLFSGESFAGPKEDFDDGIKLFNTALAEKHDVSQKKIFEKAQIRFNQAFDDYNLNSIGQAESKLFWARTNAFLDGPIKAMPLFEEAVALYTIAEKDLALKDGLSNAFFYQAENSLNIETLKKEEAHKIPAGGSSHKGKIAFANKQHELAKGFLEESLNLPQTPELKIRTGGRLAYLWTEDRDNQKAKDTLLKIVNVISDPKLKAGTQKEIIDFCLELKGKTDDTNYQSAKDALVKIVNEIVNPKAKADTQKEIINFSLELEGKTNDAQYKGAQETLVKIADEILDPQFKAETQKRIGEFFYVVKDLPNTIAYLTQARAYFSTNVGSYWSPKTLDANAVGEINIMLQHVKYLTGLYDQSVEDGIAAEKWIKASIQSSEDPQDKEKFNAKLLTNLHLLGNSYLKLHENDSRSGNIGNAESTFYALNNLLITLLKNTEENKDVSQSMFLDAESLKKASENSDYLDLLYAYQIRSNIGLMYTKIHQNNYADAASNLRLAEEKVKLLNGFYDKSTIKKRVTRAELATDIARLRLRIFATKDATQEERSSKLKELVGKWSLVSRDDIAPYYAPRHLWNLEMTLGDASFHMNDIETAKTHYIAAITEARKAGYKHTEMLARDQLALMFDTNLKAEGETIATLESELKTLNTEKTALVKEAAALKKAKSDQEESKNAEIVAKEAVIKEKEAPIAALKAKIAGFTANRDRESGIADSLKLFCGLRSSGYFERMLAYSEDDQNIYLTYLGEKPVLNANDLNSSQILVDYQVGDELVTKQEDASDVVESIIIGESLQNQDTTPIISTNDDAADRVNLVEETVTDYLESNISHDGDIIESDEEQDEKTAIITEYLEQVGLNSNQQSSTSLTDDVPELNLLWEQHPSEVVTLTPISNSLPELEDLSAYLDKEEINKSGTTLGVNKDNDDSKTKIRKRKNYGKKKINR